MVSSEFKSLLQTRRSNFTRLPKRANFVPHSTHPLQKFFAFDIISGLKAQRFVQNRSAEKFVLNPVHKRKLYFLSSVLVLSFHLSTRVPSVRYSAQPRSCRTGYIAQTSYFPSLKNTTFFSNETHEGRKAF